MDLRRIIFVEVMKTHPNAYDSKLDKQHSFDATEF